MDATEVMILANRELQARSDQIDLLRATLRSLIESALLVVPETPVEGCTCLRCDVSKAVTKAREVL